ncbi:MAG: hypothetical protein IJZ22_01785 [Bacteroidaceae bacterium]|nr:hypothetical protein [Bacteroidaceae bacterium]
MKKTFIYKMLPVLFIALTSFGFTSCSDGGGEEPSPLALGMLIQQPQPTNKLVGTWEARVDEPGERYTYRFTFDNDGHCTERIDITITSGNGVYTDYEEASYLYEYDEEGRILYLKDKRSGLRVKYYGVEYGEGTMSLINYEKGTYIVFTKIA